MHRRILEEILENTLSSLRKAGFIVESINYPEDKRSIDIVGLYGDSRIIIKVTLDASHVTDVEASDLKKASKAYNASPLIVSRRYRKRRLEPDVVYKRKGLSIVSEELLESFINRNEKPLVYEAQGTYLVRINPEKFRKRRLELGLSLGELAERIGVSRKAIYDYEHGKFSVSINTALKIAEIMGEDVFEPIDIFRCEDIRFREEFIPGNKLEEFLQRISLLKGFKIYKLLRTPIDYILKKNMHRSLSIVYYGRDEANRRVKVLEAERIVRITRSKELLVKDISDLKELEEYI